MNQIFYEAFDGVHDILAVVDMDVAEDLHPTLGGADKLGGEVVDSVAADGVDDAGEDTHLFLDAVDVKGVVGGEEEVVAGESQQEAAVHVDELGGKDEALVEVGAVDDLEDDIGVEGCDFLAVVHLVQGHFDAVATAGEGLLQGVAEG